MIAKILPYVLSFAGALVLTLVLTPLVREINRRLGMVDKPDARRINKVPIPRGGGLAIVLGVGVSYGLFCWFSGRPAMAGLPEGTYLKMTVLSFVIALWGLADDKFSLRPKVKLLGQLLVALLVWGWADLGFSDLWPWLPWWLDLLLTVFWITGAVNAFNLIDGLDGLASGLALIATVGMAGGLFFTHGSMSVLYYCALAGGLLGFLRYNYNPASVFLGDSGSMYLGFVLSTLPLASHVPHSFLVSVGVPLLAMGVPIFDTALAILRRLLRRLIANGGAVESGHVMSADTDHLHHRILRSVGLNQRKAAWTLYALAAFGVLTGFVAMLLESRAGGLWLGVVALASVVLFKDATIELFDAGLLLNRVARNASHGMRHRLAVWTVPFYVIFDLCVLVAVYFATALALHLPQDAHALRSFLPMRVASVFVFLVGFNVYRTVWSRAVGSNYARLLAACLLGSVAGSVFIYYWPSTAPMRLNAATFVYAALAFAALMLIRVFRAFVRDLFYAIDCSRLRHRKDVSRILVYGAGLRYKSFRRELVRTTSANDRMIVGLLDDDICLKGRYIGGIRIYGTLNEAPEIINRLNVDTVVIACVVTDAWLEVVKKVLAPTGVKVTRFILSEQSL